MLSDCWQLKLYWREKTKDTLLLTDANVGHSLHHVRSAIWHERIINSPSIRIQQTASNVTDFSVSLRVFSAFLQASLVCFHISFYKSSSSWINFFFLPKSAFSQHTVTTLDTYEKIIPITMLGSIQIYFYSLSRI